MKNSRFKRITLRGQTLVIALIVLFVLLLIGFVFIGILNRNLIQTNVSQQRSVAADLADAGIRYAQEQLQDNPLGADWKPAASSPVTVIDNVGNTFPTLQALLAAEPGYNKVLYTTDPDEYYMRPAPLMQGSLTQSFGQLLHAGDFQFDMGGPDGLGPFSRVSFKNGRALIRLRYAPSDVAVTTNSSFGPLRQPGKAHDSIIIESIGRPGVINANDPTSIPTFNFSNLPAVQQRYFNPVTAANGTMGVMFQWFNSQSDQQGAVSLWSQLDSQWVESRKLMAFASIGIIDDALFITNINHTSNPMDLGIPYDLGVDANDDAGDPATPVVVPMVLGRSGTQGEYLYPGTPNPVPGGGSVQINGNVNIYGTLQVALDQDLGEGIAVAGSITGQNGLNQTGQFAAINATTYSTQTGPGAATFSDGGGNPLSSSSANFDTDNGVLRDSSETTDSAGNPRGVPYRTPPDIMHVDPNTGFNRYLSITRDSGTYTISGSGNSGNYGFGQGVYVNNGGGDLQIENDENGLIASGASQTLLNDWLNPGTANPGSSWVGPYYIPAGAFLQLLPDGFQITLDSKGTFKTWRTADGIDSGQSTIRYKVSNTFPTRIIDSISYTGSGAFSDPNPDFTNGRSFNGVLYFEGNVRVRGIIPTFCPLTVVSMGNIYIEGSIVKGVTDANGVVIGGQAPETGLALLARDYVVVNTSMFFGPAPAGAAPQEVASNQDPAGVDPIDISGAAAEDTYLWTEFLLDPENTLGGQPKSVTTPQNWPAFANEYVTSDASQTPITTRMLLTDTMQDGPGSSAQVSLDVAAGAAPDYMFLLPDGTNSPLYTIGQESYQRFSQFETKGFPLLIPSTATPYSSTVDPAGFGAYDIPSELSTFFDLHANASAGTAPTNDFLLARSAIVPDDIRIEAVMYAEEGSFFVIPGQWFNPNPRDVRSAADTTATAQLTRLQSFGNDQFTPFYQEPLDVKITIVGSINENTPAPMSQQVQWDQKWAWIPSEHGASGELIPSVHNGSNVGSNYNVANGALYVPNLYLVYDPVLATGRVNGFLAPGSNSAVRTNPQDPTGLSMLPPLPCLPVSPTLIYFGEVNP